MTSERPSITLDPDVLAGKPVIRGTRLSVEFVIGLLADGRSDTEILGNYPGISRDDILACLGHDVVWVTEFAPGATDADIIAWMAREGRILLTFDKDFGELARGVTSKAVSDVLLFRIPMPRPGDVRGRLADLITARDDWAGHFSVIEPRRVRMRPLT